MFPSPFQNIAKLLFTPEKHIFDKIQALRELVPKGGREKWLSMHVRGYFNSAKGSRWAFECVNKLLRDGDIHKVVFFSESAKSVAMARTMMDEEFENRLIIPKKEFVNDTAQHMDSLGIRDQMNTATAEWYFIGEADYCMSSTIEISTFSATSIVRGSVIVILFIDMHQIYLNASCLICIT